MDLGNFFFAESFIDKEWLKRIRESEKSLIEMYSNDKLYKEECWLKKPIKTIVDLMPLFSEYQELNVLDLGCGVGLFCCRRVIKRKIGNRIVG